LETTLGKNHHELNRCREENDRLQRELRPQRDQRPLEENGAQPTGEDLTDDAPRRRDAACIVTTY